MMTAVQKRVGFSSNGKEYGFEVAKAVNYRNWEPGGEYTKLLKIKNVQFKARKIRYNISGSHFSSAVYPHSLVLRAGTSYSLPITFRPSEKNAYNEFIEFETGDGKFRVPIKAQLPRPNLTLPNALKFGMCAVQDSITVNFEISNIGNVPTNFSWKFPKGFQVNPDSGHLTPKQTCRLTATFNPQSAIVYHTSAVCTFTIDSSSQILSLSAGSDGGSGDMVESSSEPQELTKTMTLNGIGKYPHVTVRVCSGKAKPVSTKSTRLSESGRKNESKVLSSKAVKILSSDCGGEAVMREVCEGGDNGEGVMVEFGSVAVGNIAKKWIEVTNVSPVSTAFSITPVAPSSSSTPPSTSIMTPLFACSVYEGSLQPYSSTRVQLLYSPTLLTDYPSIGYFSVRAHGGLGASMVKCIGTPKGPKVCIEESVIPFGNIECGKSSTGLMHIKNNSDITATFQLQIDASSVFQCDLLSGQLGPHSSHTITVHFKPLKAIPYSRRVTCLVQHQEPLFVYFIGTATSEMARPVPLQTKHISTFLTHTQNGLSRLPPEQLKQYMDEGRVHPGGPNGALVPDAELQLPPPSLITPHTSPYAHYLHYEHEPSAVPHVSIDEEVLKFGHCPPGTQSIESKVVCVTNHTQGTLQCTWMTMSSDVFLILPEERDIPAGQTVSFSFHFRPDKPSQFYSREIECFVFYKALGDYHSVDPHTVIPPWCLTVRASGHTFSPNSETFLPKLTFDTRNVVFPPSVPGQPVYRTVLLSNTGDTPILFDIAQDPSQTFSVKPSHGLVQDKYQLLALQMIPKEAKVCNFIADVQLNARDKHKQELLMSGSGELPNIVLDNEEQLFFKPTCIGATSSTTYGVTNTSQLPVKFEWKLSNADRKVLSVHPESGIIHPNETQRHCWYFSPTETKDYSLKVILHTSLSASSSRTVSLLKVYGLGSSGQIQCTPSSLDCGTVIIGTSKQHTLSLFNPSLCDLNYRLTVEQHYEEEDENNESYRGRPFSKFDDGLVEVSPLEGVLRARSHTQIKLTIRPSRCLSYRCIIKYQLISNSTTKHPGGHTDTATIVLCTLTVCGAYPTLSVSDIQGQGTASLLSKTTLWNMLSIDEININLCDEPSAGELRYAIATRHSMKRRVPVRTRAVVNFDFGAAPVNSESSMVHLVLENKGGVPTEWAFQFPIDMHLEPEYWADTGQLDEIERHELDVINNELFTVTPKRGTLTPGERITVIATFKHTHIGTSKLPVLLKINRGREILLNWQGVTVEHGRPYVHFSTQHHSFDAVPIGIHAYPRQEYTLYNTSDSPVTYRIDTSPLEQLKETNYLMSVLECLQPEGDIPPMSCVPVEFVFSPLEAKKYSVDLPIHLSSGDTILISFTGEGYDPHSLVDEDSDHHHTTLTNVIPVHSNIAVAGQQAQLSQENFAFGDLPLFAAVRRIVFVKNCCQHTLSFQWDLMSERAKEVVSVQPWHGYIQPGQSTACKVTICSHSSPSYYNLDLVCKVMDESRYLAYQTDLREWERQEEEKKHLFTITQTDTTTPNKSPMSRPKSMPKMKALSSVSGKKSGVSNKKSRPLSSDSELRGKYHTLPPIGSSEETYEEWKKRDLSVRNKTRPRTRMTSENKPPIPPDPLSLHLGVTAKTLSIPDYSTLRDNLDSFYIDQQSLIDSSNSSTGENGLIVGGCVRVRDEEKDMLENVLNQMIRELLEDANFHKAVSRVTEEPTPYFTQFASRMEHSPSVQQSAHRHLYAAGLEGIPVGDEGHTLHPSSSSPPHILHPSQSQCLVDDTNDDLVVTNAVSEVRFEEDGAIVVGDESAVLIKEEGRDEVDSLEMDAQIKHHLEYRGLVEGILENTLLNILKEANAGDFNISAPMYNIAKPETV